MIKIRHIGLVAKDIDLLVRFYTSVFELKIVDRKVESGIFIERLVGIPEAQLEWAKLVDANGIMVEILHYHSHNDYSAITCQATKPGTFHIAFTVESVEQTQRCICNEGGQSGPLQTNPEGNVRVFYAKDPEGNQIEIVQCL